MQTIALRDLNLFLLREAIAHTRTWLRALRWSPARTQLLRLLAQAEVMIPRLDQKGIADEARELAGTLEMEGFGIGGNTQFPQTLWPGEFTRNPWDFADEWPRLTREQVQIRWERWNLRRDSFGIIAHRVKWIIWTAGSFEDPRLAEWGNPQGTAPLYRMRHTLMRMITAPDLARYTTISARRAAGEKLEGNEINDLAVRQPAPVDWIHVENDEGSSYPYEDLRSIAEAAYAAGLRGVYFTQPGRDKDAGKAWVYHADSDVRLRCWLPSEQWREKCHTLTYAAAA